MSIGIPHSSMYAVEPAFVVGVLQRLLFHPGFGVVVDLFHL